MKALLLQLSDVHFNSHSNAVSSRAASIRGAVQEMALECEACFVVMTGDVAWSGQSVEYEQAHLFFDQLRDELRGLRSWQVEEVFIPGNHDCVLPKPDLVREIVIGSMLSEVKTPFRPADQLIEQCVQVQNPFFDFYARRTGRTLNSTEWLCYTHRFEVGGRTFRFECYNSAWMSQRAEKPGQLLIPLGQAKESEPVDLVASLFHHPYNWLLPENGRAFRKEVEARSDLVMTGHEHVSEQYDKSTLDKTNLSYFEGAVLQEHGNDDSGFNAMVIDFEKRERQITTFLWRGDYYASTSTSGWESFDRNVRLARARFENTPDFLKILHDVGAPFTHSAKPQLCLKDVFVYPDCDERTYDQDDSDSIALHRIGGKELVSHVMAHPHVLFLGNESCGKSALGRTLYLELQSQKLIPLWLNGVDLGASDAEVFGKSLSRAAEAQYGPEMVERYSQLDASQKAVIVDNFHLIKGNLKAQSLLLSRLKERFGRVILLADEVLNVKELAQKGDDENALLSFNHCEMVAFGYRSRGQLIEKWVGLGRENMTGGAGEFTQRVKEAENLVTTLLGKSLLPGYPIFVLTILQQYEAHSVPDTPSGSFGYYYEFLIFDALKNRSKKIPLDLVYAFTSYLAYWMFDNSVKSIDQDQFDEVAKDYQKVQKLNFNSTEMLRILQDAAVLRANVEGKYRFQYRYSSYYFIARFIKDNLYTVAHEQKLRARIEQMIEKVYVEDYANIVIFLVYLTRDERTIAGLLAKSKTLFAHYEPCNLTDHVAIVRQLKAEMPLLRLTAGSDEQHRDEHRHRMDEAERGLATHDPAAYDSDEDSPENQASNQEFDRQHKEVLSYNTAFKTLQILGQILRNFPGTLPGDLKIEITRESYDLGMRVLRSMFTMVENNLENIRELIYGLLCEAEEPKTEDERKKIAARVDDIIHRVLSETSHGMVKRISFAVGSELLKPTYDEVVDDRMPVSVDMIHTAIKLDHFSHFPEKEVTSLYGRLDKHLFASSILRRMVRDYFYLYPADRRLRDSICARLGIKMDIVKALNPSHKERI